jgi:two-component system phosphate regulon response regulator PhoB
MNNTQSILVVEDNERAIRFVSQILENHDYRFSVARNGNEALEAMKKERPSLVLLDIMMPRKSGVNVYQQMKKDPSLKHIPIVITTGASQVTGVDMKTGEQEKKETYGDDFARGIGEMIKEKLDGFTPDGFIEKPIDPPVLIAKIKELLP